MDAEKDGIARLASDHDDRITPVGRLIRAIRFDELQLRNQRRSRVNSCCQFLIEHIQALGIGAKELNSGNQII